jgi:hypothetical protein
MRSQARTDMPTWVVNLSPAARRMLALGLLALFVFAAWLIVQAALANILNSNARIADQRLVAGRMQTVAALKPSLLAAANESGGSSSDDYFAGDTVATIRAAMQTRLNEIADINGVNLMSVSNAPERRVGDAVFIGIRADLAGTVTAIHGTLFAIETNRPAFVVREASIWGIGDEEPAGVAPPQITAQFHIYVPLRPELGLETLEEAE